MGVPQFFSFLRRRYPEIVQSVPPSKVASLSIDMNSLFHQAAGKTYGYADDGSLSAYEKEKRMKQAEETEPEILKMELFSTIWTMVITIVNNIHPQDALIIAVDGMAPMAKIQQQRQRRYKSVQEKKSKVFDSNAFSPGTDLMIDLDKFLRRKLLSLDRKQSEAIFIPYKVIYSGHLDPGEGEHKILEYYRKGWTDGRISADGGSHVIHGLDADLIMLSMLMSQDRVFVMRENDSKYRDSKFDILNIDRLRESISIDLGTSTAIDDFLVMMYFMGNDFLPRIKSLNKFSQVVEILLETYKKVGKSLTLAGGEEINWIGLALFLRSFKLFEPKLVQGLSETVYKFDSHVIESATHRHKVDFNEFRNEWYNYALAAPLGSKNMINKLKIPENLTKPTKSQIMNMGLQFLTGMAWTSLYYRKGMVDVNREWSYPYFYAPLLVDLAVVAGYVAVNKANVHIGQYKDFPGSINYNVVHQMLCILPPPSKTLVPEEVQAFYLPQSPIIDQFPDSFRLDKDGKEYEWQFHALVPHAEIRRIYIVTDYVTFSKATQESLKPQEVTIQTRKTKTQILIGVKPSFGRWSPKRERGPPKDRERPVGNYEERQRGRERSRESRERERGRERREGGEWERERGRGGERPISGGVQVTENRVETRPPRRHAHFEERGQVITTEPVKPFSVDVKQIRFKPRNRIMRVRPLRHPLRPKKTQTPLEILAQFNIDYSSVPIIFT